MVSEEELVLEVPLEEALERWSGELEFCGLGALEPGEEVAPIAAYGRIAADPVVARRPSPHYYAAVVDGLAVRSAATYQASEETPLTVRLGSEGSFVGPGSPLPPGADAVVPLHEVQFVSVEEVRLHKPCAPWRNISPTGEDFEAAEVIVPRGGVVRSAAVGAMLRSGVQSLKVRVRPQVRFVPLGDSLVPPGEEPQAGQQVEAISAILGGLCQEMGASASTSVILPERADALDELADRLQGIDVLVLIAGRTHGTAMPAAWLATRNSLLVHGVKLKPGGSVALGLLHKVPVVVLPGNVVSSYVAFGLFVRPLLARLLGVREQRNPSLGAVLALPVTSPLGVDEFLRVQTGQVGDRLIALPVSRGADIVSSLVQADGLLHVPAPMDKVPEGAWVRVECLDTRPVTRDAVIVMGTHDPAVELLSNLLMRLHPDVVMRSANVGSRAGLAAVAKGYAHMAGLHLFDEASASYNEPFVRQALPSEPWQLINVFRRHLGFVVPKGNPLGITTFGDLARSGARFINRQTGSGTRVLIDHQLRRHAIEPSELPGYETSASTHMAVAAAVASGTADVGVGIATAARALGLDFVPLLAEQLDLLVLRRSLGWYPVQCLLAALRSAEFREALNVLPHYDTMATGRVLAEGGHHDAG